METFLDKLAAELEERCPGFESVAVVFPTRRAGLFFREAVAKRLSRPTWMPVLYSIQDFIRSRAGASIPDTLTLQAELFHVYKKYYPGERFADFLPWSEALLNDFDEADRYLLDAKSYFRNIRDLQEIGQSFGLSPEDESIIREFWKSYFDTPHGKVQDGFYKTWEHLHGMYTDFRKVLAGKGWSYEGMAYRTLCEGLEQGTHSIPYAQTVFAGLYALSPSEERMIRHLVKEKKALVYWDADRYYTDDARQEAGRFLRGSKLTHEQFNWKFDYFRNQARRIVSVGVPLQIGQARSAGMLLDTLVKETGSAPHEIAVVLADERLLFPMLYSLPESIGAVNVTMGFPLKEAPLFHFLETLVRMQREFRTGANGSGTFYHQHVAEIMGHAVLRDAEPVFAREWLNEYRNQRWVRIEAGTLTKPSVPALVRSVFQPVATDGWCDYFLEVLQALLAQARRNGQDQKMESEFIFRFYTLVNRLGELLPLIGEALEVESFWRLVSGIAGQVKVPFTGEPLKGLQVMGLLESRCLDFKHVFVLAVNEELLPASSDRISFVPFGIRKAFGLPGTEEKQAVSAYHFFRLIQRAETIHLLHNTEAAGLTTGERSRLVSQLELELAKRVPDKVSIEELILVPPASPAGTGTLSVPKSAAVLQALQRFGVNGSTPGPYTPKISPSALSAYIHCSLKFYFSYVAGLRETEEVEDSMDARLFGDVLHGALHDLYREGRRYGTEELDALLEQVPAAVHAAIRTCTHTTAEALEGKDIILRNVLVHLVRRIVQLDQHQVPFTIGHLERTFVHEVSLASGLSVRVGGKVDRIDEWQGNPRILDYKTGHVDIAQAKSVTDLFTNEKYKEQFQAFFYAWLFARTSGKHSVRTGLVVARKLDDGIQYLNGGEPLDAAQLEEFESHLVRTIEEIYHPEKNFTRTEDITRCRYCAFREICQR